MTPIHIAHLFNLFGGGMVLVLSLMFYSRFPSAFFRYWAAAFGAMLAYVAGEWCTLFWGRPWQLLVVEFAFLLAMGGAIERALSLRRGSPPRPARYASLGAGLFIVSTAALALGCPFELALSCSALPMMIGTVRLGWSFWQPPAGQAEHRVLAASMMGFGLWPLIYPYPLLVNTPYAWIGYAGSGALQALMGLAMMAHNMDEAWRLHQEEQARLDRQKNDFIAVIGHELRSPLTSVTAYAEFLEDGLAGPLTSEQLQFVDHIQRGTRRLKRLVEDLMAFSQVEGHTLKLTRGPVEVVGLTQATVASLMPVARTAEVSLSAELPAAPLWTLGDQERLEQVLANLVGNAIKFTPPGGRVMVQLVPDSAELRLTVSDTGIGIAPEELPRIFEKFYQGDASSPRMRGGAGLGLAISKGIADGHGGRLTCESEVGRGTAFHLILPAAPQAAARLVSADS